MTTWSEKLAKATLVNIRFHYARLLATKPEFLLDFQKEFNSYETTQDAAYAKAYSTLIDCVVNNTIPDYVKLVESCCKEIEHQVEKRMQDL